MADGFGGRHRVHLGPNEASMCREGKGMELNESTWVTAYFLGL